MKRCPQCNRLETDEALKFCRIGCRLETLARHSRQIQRSGVILIVVLMTLTLLGIVGVTFVYYAAANDCSQNPTIETRDGRCVKTIGPDNQ